MTVSIAKSLAMHEGTQATVTPLADPSQAATAPLFRAIEDGDPLPKSIVLVVVESLGHSHRPALNDLIWRHFQRPEILDAYRVETGTVEFDGSTVPGELREFCGLRVSSVRPPIDKALRSSCLPHLLKAKGYDTIGYHGYLGSFFNRKELYPAIGFETVHFASGIQRLAQTRRRCGWFLFRGACDADVAQLLASELKMPGRDRLFLYWLTLNAHQPLGGPPEQSANALDCADASGLSADSVCWMIEHHDIVLGALAEIAADPGVSDTAFIVVGDHSPGGMAEDAPVFSSELVPYLRLWPRPVPSGATSS